MKIPGQITISTRRSPDEGKVHIELRDPNAIVRFLALSMDMANFTRALGGLSCCDCEIEVHDLEKVGKIRESKPLEFELATHDFGDKRMAMASAAAADRCPDGWTPNVSFNSQDSFYTRDGKSWARTTMHRWVERTEEEDNG